MVTLSKAPLSELSLLREMANDYYNQLSRYRELSATQASIVDTWISHPCITAFLIKTDDKTAGFVVVVNNPALPGVDGNYLAEFYIAPQYRESKVALLAGGALMRDIPGNWTADVLAKNITSLRFTRAMTRRYGRNLRERLIESPYGAAHRFRWSTSAKTRASSDAKAHAPAVWEG